MLNKFLRASKILFDQIEDKDFVSGDFFEDDTWETVKKKGWEKKWVEIIENMFDLELEVDEM